MILFTRPSLRFEDNSHIRHWRVWKGTSCLTRIREKKRKNACGKIIPQWRLSLEDLGQPGNRNRFRDKTGCKRKNEKWIFSRTRQNACLSKLRASYRATAATRARRCCFGAETRPGANSHGGQVRVFARQDRSLIRSSLTPDVPEPRISQRGA